MSSSASTLTHGNRTYFEYRKWYQSLYYPTNAHNVKNVELLKLIKIMEAAPTCFGLQRNHHQGARASAQPKLKDWFSADIEVVQTLSLVCVLCTVQAYTLAQCTTHTPHMSLCCHSTDTLCGYNRQFIFQKYKKTEQILVIIFYGNS